MSKAEKRLDGKAIREIEAELEVPPLPSALHYVWRAYLRMRRRKAAGFASFDPIEWPDIQAFINVSGFRLAPWEVELIEAIDDVFLSPGPVVVVPETPREKVIRSITSASNGDRVKDILGSIGKRRTVKRKAKVTK
jgi:hypothetical protein